MSLSFMYRPTGSLWEVLEISRSVIKEFLAKGTQF